MRARLSLLLATLLLLAPLAWAQASADTVARAARAQVGVTQYYAPAYTRIPCPMGDLPKDRGVCTDVVIRAFRAAGVDLQARVHEDMRGNFRAYPQKWGLKQPDSNIDHRRVPNLQRWFQRQGKAVPVSANAADYRAGDVVSWKLPNGLDHIGVVSTLRSRDGARPMVVHNIGAGAREEDVLFAWPQTGHYRAFPPAGGASR
jgi:uncharacterized protein YijF (DUF1287 family)